jgi:hypothetical protein
MSRRPANPERSFGVSVGLFSCALAAALAWRGDVNRAEVVGVIGIGLLAAGLLRPSMLKRPSAWWWRLSGVLGAVNARVLLTLMFALVFVPISLLWRAIGLDPLALRRDRWQGWSPYPARYRDPHHYRRMF